MYKYKNKSTVKKGTKRYVARQTLRINVCATEQNNLT